MADYRCKYCGHTESRPDNAETPRCMHFRKLLLRNGIERVKYQTYPAIIVPGELVAEIESIFTEEKS